ncbi:hypothetical protein [Sphingomonas sp.]|uniref:hypothetical protein n=1 Tax=Sphingomonas sp. TaxID=28214 RepID=UPI0035C7A227
MSVSKASVTGLAFVLLVGCGDAEPSSQPELKTFSLPFENEALATECGGAASQIPVRDCARLAESRRYAGLYFRTFEGSSFLDGTRPGRSFNPESDGYVELYFDEKTKEDHLLPNLDGLDSDVYYLEFVGRRVTDRSSRPEMFGAPPLIVVDHLLRAGLVPNEQVKKTRVAH